MLPLLCELKLNECLFLLSSICPGTHVVILCYSEINTKFLGPIPGHPRYERVQRGAIYSPRGYGSALSGPEITLCQRLVGTGLSLRAAAERRRSRRGSCVRRENHVGKRPTRAGLDPANMNSRFFMFDRFSAAEI